LSDGRSSDRRGRLGTTETEKTYEQKNQNQCQEISEEARQEESFEALGA
jgi:hypothetical protein